MKSSSPETDVLLKISGPSAILSDDFVIKKINPAFASLLGLSNTSILHKSLFELSPFELEEKTFRKVTFPHQVTCSIKPHTKTGSSGASVILLIKLIQGDPNTLFLELVPLEIKPQSPPEPGKGFDLSFMENFNDLFFYETRFQNKSESYRVTDSVKKITGYSSKELGGFRGKLLQLIHEEDAAKTIKELNSLKVSGKQRFDTLNFRIRRKDGDIRWLREYILFLPDEDKTGYQTFSIVIDLTDLKKHEHEFIEERNQLIEKSEAKDRFINILSHDLRAPFTSILGFAEILLNESELGQNEKTEYLNYIYDASQNQLQFINYLLDWSRLRTGSLKIEPQRLKVLMIVYNCISALTGNAIRKNIDIQTDISENLYIQADERLISQVIMNLLNNAIKFSNENSVIEITASLFNPTQMEFTIKDQGVGISPEDQQKIFSIEKTYSREGTKGEKGSGFGLALVKEIIEKHGGEIWFYSEEGKGTEFHFTVPLPANSILVVHDEPGALDSINDLLRTSFPEFSIVTAENGFEAMGINIEENPNLIITKHDLPLMNGLQLIESLKKSDYELRTPVIILLDENDPAEIRKYQSAGVKSILIGEVKRDQLISAVSAELHK
ncbi:MAG: PAS domain-containing protein [Ignavibacteriaceae bacterium]|nr:PAS domain-containing protein [Ignavibacteriaceae bacterium]